MGKHTIKFRDLPKTKIPKVIPPKSLVILAKIDAKQSPDWKTDVGRIFRVGYYSRNDGLDCIWLVNSNGEYEQTIDRAALLDHFILLKLSNEADFYGEHRKPLKPLTNVNRPTDVLIGAST